MPAQQQGLAKLKFKEKLLQSGRSAGSDALQKRLKTLHDELRTLEQDTVDLRSLQKVAEELVAQQILLHRDTGVKAYTACCLVDILRLFAPDAPYTTFQLDDIFNFILDQIETNLRAPASIFSASSSGGGGTKSRSGKEAEPTIASRLTDIPYYQEYLYTLESLATIKSVVCIGDIDKPEQLVMRHFEIYFKILRPNMNRAILGYMQEILVTLVEDQKDHLPEGVLELLLAQLRTFKDHKDHPAFIMATGILRFNAEALQRHLHNYFIETVMRHGKDPLDEEIVKLNDVYSLLVTLYCYCPDILSNILPVLEEQVRGDNQCLREMATTTLGQMFGSVPAASAAGSAAAIQLANLAGPMRSTWTAWLGRRIDKSVAIRLAWVASARNVLINHEEMRHDLETALREKLIDPEEKVRAAVCKLYGKLPYEVALHNVDIQSLKSVAERLQDKKVSVSTEALRALGTLYKAAYVEIDDEETLAMNQFSWIPEAIMHAGYAAGSVQYNHAVRETLSTYIVPLPSRAEDEKSWVDRLVVVAQNMDDAAFTALMKHSNLMSPGIEPWNMFATACELNNKEPTKEQNDTLHKLSRFLAMTMPDFSAAAKALQEFADAELPRLYKLLRSLTDISLDLKTLLKAKAEFLKKLEGTHPSLVDTLTAMLHQSSMWIVNRTSIPHLLQRLTGSNQSRGPTTAQNILSFVAKHCPGLYSTHVAALQIAVVSKHVSHSEVALQALASLAKFQPETAIKESRMLDKVASLCDDGSIKQAKFAARILAYSDVQEGRCAAVIANAIEHISCGDHLLASLAAVAEFARAGSTDFEARAGEITEVVTDKVLMHCFSETKGDDEIWQSENDLDVWSRSKILALKIGINHCVAQAREPGIVEVARPTIRRLIAIVDREGSITDETRDNGALRLHLRLKAASGLLKMAQHTKYDRELTNADYETIAMTCQDSEYAVRAAFLKKLSKVLHHFHISPRWYMVPMVSAVDPDETNVQAARSLVRSLAKKMDSKTKIELLDRPFTRLLCFLSHHPDLEAVEAGGVRFLAKYLRFYIETVVNQENVSLIYHLASRLKTVRDRNRSLTDEKLYMVSEMACLVLNHYAKQHSWQIATYPGKETMAKDLFVLLQPGSDELRQVRTKSYLPDDAPQWLNEPIRKAGAVRPRAERVSLSPASSTKRRAAKTRARKSRAKRTKREDSPEDSPDESEDEADSDVDMPDEMKEATPEAPEGEEILGRGGTRRAKRKAAQRPQAAARPNK